MSRLILHICGDYPDAFQQNKTPVITRFVDGLSLYAVNMVISINRVNNPWKEAVIREGNLWSIRYFSPPYGILQSWFLDRFAEKLAQLLKEAGIRVDIMVGHKFTIESYICWRLSRLLGVPYLACFMGNTDTKVFRVKPHYRPVFREVAHAAKAIIFPTPWCARFFTERLLRPAGIPEHRLHLIPYISGDSLLPIPLPSRSYNSYHFITICRLDIWRLKNLHRLIKAVAILRKTEGDWRLDIVGPGSTSVQNKLKRLISRHGVDQYVRLLGIKSREQIDSLLPNYCAMVMPSYPESFGLVYLEALAKGVPIMTAKGAGMDGFFSDSFPGVAVKHDELGAIVEGLVTLSKKCDVFRERIQAAGAQFKQFDREVIISHYATLLNLKLETGRDIVSHGSG